MDTKRCHTNIILIIHWAQLTSFSPFLFDPFSCTQLPASGFYVQMGFSYETKTIGSAMTSIKFLTKLFPSVPLINLTKFLEEISIPQEVVPVSHCPFLVLQMDFTDLLLALGNFHCLVIVCMFCGWTKYYLTRRADATIVVKKLITDYSLFWHTFMD